MPDNERIFEELSEEEQDTCRTVIRRLLKHTFIVAEKNDNGVSRREFRFARAYQDTIRSLLSPLGYTLVIDQDADVAMLKDILPERSINKFRFRKLKTAQVLIALCLIYDDYLVKKSVTRNVVVGYSELKQTLDRYSVKIDMKSLREALLQLKDYNLAACSGKPGDENFTVTIYPSVCFCTTENFHSIVTEMDRRMREGDSSDNTDTDETEDDE